MFIELSLDNRYREGSMKAAKAPNPNKHDRSIASIIDNSLQKFYSSRPRREISKDACACMREQLDKDDEIKFYQEQQKLIGEVGKVLTQPGRPDSEDTLGRILLMMVDYIVKILELLQQESMCECKRGAIREAAVLSHKVKFMREENDKFFKLFEEKNQECEALQSKVAALKSELECVDFMPLTTRKQNKKQNSLCWAEQPKGQELKQNSSISTQSSKVSQWHEPITTDIKSMVHLGHTSYFKEQTSSQKEKKSRIFTNAGP